MDLTANFQSSADCHPIGLPDVLGVLMKSIAQDKLAP